MIDRGRSADNLVVGERRGVSTFAIAWRAGRRRHTVLLGSERDGWTE